MRGRVRRALAAGLLGVTLAGCATFPDDSPRDWQEQLEGAGELGGIPRVPEAGPPSPSPPGESAPPPTPTEPLPCSDPDPAVVATCLDPVSAVAVLPDGETALVAERSSGRVVRVRQGTEPVEIVTVPVDSTGGGGLTGLALSPSYAEDRLAYAYITTPQDNRIVLLAGSAPPRTIFAGIPRSDRDNGGALAFDVDGSLLIATGEVDGSSTDPGSLAGKLLRINARGEPAAGNPDPASPVLSSGLQAPGGICINSQSSAVWVTDRRSDADALHHVVPGDLPAPAWRWPDRPGVGGCAAQRDDGLQQDIIAVSQSETRAIALFRTSQAGAIEDLESILTDKYGRFTAATLAPDGLIWVGTGNKNGGTPVPTDDRVIRLPPFAEGGASVVSHHHP